MNDTVPETLTVLPNRALFRAARSMQRVGLGVAAVAIVFGFLQLAGVAGDGTTVAMARGSLPLLATAFFCVLSLLLLASERTSAALKYAQPVANVLVLFAAAVAFFWSRAAGVGARSHIVFPPSRLAIGFVALALAVALVDKGNWLINRVVDVLVCGLCLLNLLLVADLLADWLAIFAGRASSGILTSVLLSFVALTAVIGLRQAEHGVLSIFLGVGIGSDLARIFAPILLLLPFVWQAVDARLKGRFGSTTLASAGVAAAVGILMFFAWRISRMENEIHDLVLRDDATRIYNHRGFHMLAEHALRLAKRSGVPFSVLFIDFENLAHIHTQLGPDVAAASLAEAGEILRATFRESDIKGRIGADEFAVAGRFDRAGISVAALRLEAAAAARSAKSGRPIPFKFSMGHVTTTDPEVQENLKDLLARAGHEKNRMDFQLSEMHVN